MKRGITIPETALVVTFLVAASVVRFIGLARYSFDPDEIFTVRTAQLGWGGLLSTVAGDVSHPPLFYMLLKIWLWFGPATEGWVRALPALLGSAAFVPLLLICRRLRLDAGGMAVALALFAANGMLIHYAQYARMFALLELTSALSILAFTVFVQAEGKRGFWALAIANILMVHAHYWGWMVVLAQAGILLIFHRDCFVAYAKAAALAVAAFLPWVWMVANAASTRGSATTQIQWMGAPDGSNVVWLLGNLTGAPNIPRGTSIGLALFAVPIAFALWRAWRARDAAAPALALLVAVPIAATIALGYASGQSVWGERHLIVVAIPYFLLVAAGTCAVPWPKLRAALQVVIMAWATFAGAQFLMTPNQMLQWGPLVDGIVEASPERPMVIRTAEPYLRDPVRYYVERNGAEGVTVTMGEDPTIGPDARFWFVFRDTTWRLKQSPAQMLVRGGLTVESMLAITTDSQRVVALKVRRGTASPRSLTMDEPRAAGPRNPSAAPI